MKSFRNLAQEELLARLLLCLEIPVGFVIIIPH
jgi:hypothetical protein